MICTSATGRGQSMAAANSPQVRAGIGLGQDLSDPGGHPRPLDVGAGQTAGHSTGSGQPRPTVTGGPAGSRHPKHTQGKLVPLTDR